MTTKTTTKNTFSKMTLPHGVDYSFPLSIYEGESNENLKYDH